MCVRLIWVRPLSCIANANGWPSQIANRRMAYSTVDAGQGFINEIYLSIYLQYLSTENAVLGDMHMQRCSEVSSSVRPCILLCNKQSLWICIEVIRDVPEWGSFGERAKAASARSTFAARSNAGARP